MSVVMPLESLRENQKILSGFQQVCRGMKKKGFMVDILGLKQMGFGPDVYLKLVVSLGEGSSWLHTRKI